MTEPHESLTTAQVEPLSQTLLELITEACLLTTRCGVIQAANKAAYQLLGASQSRLVGETLENYLTASEQPAFFAQLSQLELANGFQSFSLQLQPRGQVPSVVQASVTLVQKQPGHSDHLCWHLRSGSEHQEVAALRALNTQLKQQAQAQTAQLQRLLEFEERLRLITEQVRQSLDPDQILRTAVQELVLGLKVECCDATLYNADYTEVTLAYEYSQSFPSAQGCKRQLTDQADLVAELHQERPLQFCLLAPSAIRPNIAHRFAIFACPLVDGARLLGDLWLFKPKQAVFDETEQQLIQQVANQCVIALRQARLYQAAQTQVQAVEKLNALKDDFLSTISHELRTPITNMRMAIQMLELSLSQKEQGSTAPTKTTEYFAILKTECQREIDLINDLLDLQRLEAAAQPLALEPIPVSTWLKRLLEPFKKRCLAYQQRLRVDCPDALPPFVSDRLSVERILLELLNNACKYTPAGEEILVVALVQDEQARFTVSNTGTEIPLHEIPHVFDKFYRIPKADPWQRGGTGLGLSLVRKLVAHLGGEIAVESKSNQTQFTVVLPSLRQPTVGA
jgi:signal transduction histidine kinase